MSNPRVEALGKSRRLFYEKATGKVIGLASGGGAIATLRGDDLIVATFNDEEAPERIGCFEVFYNPIGKGRPLTVDLASAGEYLLRIDAFRAARIESSPDAVQDVFAALSEARDECVTFAPAQEPDEQDVQV